VGSASGVSRDQKEVPTTQRSQYLKGEAKLSIELRISEEVRKKGINI